MQANAPDDAPKKNIQPHVQNVLASPNTTREDTLGSEDNQPNNPITQQYLAPNYSIPMMSKPSVHKQSNVIQDQSGQHTTIQPSIKSHQHEQQNLQQNQPSAAAIQTSSLPSQPTVVTMPIIKPLLESETAVSSSSPQVPQSNPPPGSSPQKSVVTKVKLSDELNVFDWLRTTDIINQIAEKARSSVDSVITILDPGMKEYLYSGGNINIMVISHSGSLISPVRDAFQSVFGRATVIPTPTNSLTDYPIKLALGFEQAISVARERIKRLRTDTSNVPQNQVIAVVQPSLVSIYNDPSPTENIGSRQADEIIPRWFLTYCILIEDPVLNLTINSHSQFIPLDDDIITQAAKESIYPTDFNDKHLGFSTSIDQLMSSKLQLYEAEDESNDYGCLWLPKWSGNYETQIIHQLALSLANEYRRKWTDCVRIETMS